jgi:hypothetical protein
VEVLVDRGADARVRRRTVQRRVTAVAQAHVQPRTPSSTEI